MTTIEAFEKNRETEQMHGCAMHGMRSGIGLGVECIGWGKDYGAAMESVHEAHEAIKSCPFNIAFEQVCDTPSLEFRRVTTPWAGCTIKAWSEKDAEAGLHKAFAIIERCNSRPEPNPWTPNAPLPL